MKLGRKVVMDTPVLNTEDLGVEVLDVLIALLVCHRVYQHEAITFPHVLFPHGTELFLAGCIQHYSTHTKEREEVSMTGKHKQFFSQILHIKFKIDIIRHVFNTTLTTPSLVILNPTLPHLPSRMHHWASTSVCWI